MPEYRIRETGQVMYEDELRRWASATTGASWGRTTDEVLAVLGADPVFEGPQAVPASPYEYSMRSGVEQIDGKWYTKYVLGPIFTDTPEATAAEQEAAYKARLDAEQGDRVRADRTARLAACDWTQLADAPVDAAAWAAYRQDLRDVPSQAGFPWEVVWPVAP